MSFSVFLSDLRRRWREGARLRIMVYALTVSLLCGATGFLQPVDDAIRNHRYQAREVSPDGSIVVIGIDQASLDDSGGAWPIPRTIYASLIDRLKAAGARRIVFDMAMADTQSAPNDRAFIDVLKKYRGDIYLGLGFGRSTDGAYENSVLPTARIRPYVKLASFKVWVNPIGQVSEVFMDTAGKNVRYPSLSSVLSGRQPVPGKRIRPDYSIKYKEIPFFSVSDVIRGRFDDSAIFGKDILVGATARSLGDIRFLPAQGQAPGVFVHAIAAQTLKNGTPAEGGWVIATLFVIVGSISILITKKPVIRLIISVITPILLAIVPIWFDSIYINIEVAPAALLYSIVLVQSARLRWGWKKSRVNEGSGLANVVALRELESRAGSALIAAKVENYAAITASFPRDVESGIVAEIVGRLRLKDDELQVYQADDGVFYWISAISRPSDLGNHLEGLKALFASAMKIGDRRVDVSVSFGADLDWARPVASRAGSALLCAEEALRTGQRWKLYDPTRTADAAWQLSLASEIDRAMDTEQFWLAYQPKLNLKTGRITGGEVLLRWKHPERGEISPSEFIPAAERSQRIGRLTDYVVQRALASAQLLAADGDYKLAVNVSVPVLGDPDFAHSLLMKCEGAGVRPERIMIEITESVLMSADDAQVEATLAQLRNCGFGLSIDDFGTGFSSLEYVRRIPAHEMKIDQSFVRRVLNSPADRVVVESVLQMAHELGRNVVAEGVEDAATLDLLRELGCDEVQGYHIGRPVDFATFRASLVSSKRAAA